MSGLYAVLVDRLESCLVCMRCEWTDFMSVLYAVLIDILESCLVCILSSWTDLSHVWFVYCPHGQT